MLRTLCAALICVFSLAEGYQRFGKETVDSIQANGVVVLQGTEVTGFVQVNGNLEAAGATIGSLEVNGQAELYQCTVRNGTVVNGALTGMNTAFQGGISAASQKIVLKSCFSPSLLIRPINGYYGVQWIVLSEWTKIPGPITVESGRGEIWMSTYSNTITQISGARVYNQVLD